MAEVTVPDLRDSCLVVAHPDDEVLWFSSILATVERVVLCFEDCPEYPQLGPGRRAVLQSYPLQSVTSLRLSEPCSVHLVDWSSAEPDEHGMKLDAARATDAARERYRHSHAALRETLASQLRGVPAVFTHNPWGEYGHPDHVQLALVLESLRSELGFRLFHSSYVAHRTMPLASRFLPNLSHWFELPTDPALADSLQAVYERHACWTWPANYQRFSTETFLEAGSPHPEPGSGFRLNCITA